MEPLISVRNLNHYFGEGQLRKQVLFDISAEILPGEIVISTGPSGSGKTTLLTLIGALRTVQDGSLRILNQELRGAGAKTMMEVRRNIGFIFQAHNLLDSLTACQNVQMTLDIDSAVSGREARERGIELLEKVGLGDRVNYLPGQMSGGQKQRVAIARALVHKPKIVLADEPTAALDKKSGREVVDILHQLAKQHGCAILLVTHDNRILDVADRILTLEDGRISSFTAGAMANTGHLMAALKRLHGKGDLKQHVASLSDAQFIDMLAHVTQEFEQFLETVDLANHMAAEDVLDEVLEAVTVKTREVLNADRATLYLVEPDHGMLRSKIAEQEGAEALEIRVPVGKGIAGRVAKTGESLNIEDAWSHPDFNREVDERTGYRTRSLLCMPVYNRKGEVFAVAQLLNRRDGQPFSRGATARFAEFAKPLGVILEGCCLVAARSRPV